MHILTIRFKKGTQEIRFGRFPWLDLPDIEVVNNENGITGCTVKVNGKRYCAFYVPSDGWVLHDG